MEISHRHWILYIVAVVVVGSLLLAGAWALYFARWSDGQFFGEVRSVAKNRIIITDRKEGERSFFLNEETKIRHGGDEVDSVAVGDFVIVFSKRGERGEPVAGVIRIVEDDEPFKKGGGDPGI